MEAGRLWPGFWLVLAILYVMSAEESGSVKFTNDEPAAEVVEAAKANITEGQGRDRGGKHLLEWLVLGGGGDADPYLAKLNGACLEGDLAECFKARALSTLDDFFTRESYTLNENARIVRMPVTELRSLYREPYEFSEETRAEEPEWDQFVKFLLRKVEKFVKSAAVEVQLSDEVTAEGRYSPRFLDEIYSEMDTLEDKSASKHKRNKLKKLFIPLLVILKLFKLKLLLFLPLILGLASFKKLLGFLAIVIPGLIGFFKLCKPDLHHNYGSFGHSSFYHRPPHQHQFDPLSAPHHLHPYRQPEYFRDDSHNYRYGEPTDAKQSTSGSIAFRDEATDSHQLAYQGYADFQQHQ